MPAFDVTVVQPRTGWKPERSVQSLRLVLGKTRNPFACDGSERFIERRLVRREGFVPDGRSSGVVDHFEKPTGVVLTTLDQRLDGDAAFADAPLQGRMNDPVFVVHSGKRSRW